MKNEKIKSLNNLQNNLRILREKSKMTQREVASELFISYQSYQSYELGKSVPTLANFIKLAQIFNVSLEDLLKK